MQVISKGRPVKLSSGGTAYVKRLSRTKQNDCVGSIGGGLGIGALTLATEMLLRAAVVALEDHTAPVVDGDGFPTGERQPYTLKREKHPMIGEVCERAFIDTLSDADIEALSKAMDGTPTEAQQGNSSPLPAGSTASG